MSTESDNIMSVTAKDRVQVLTLSSDKRIKMYQIMLAASKPEEQLFSHSWLLTFGSPYHRPHALLILA